MAGVVGNQELRPVVFALRTLAVATCYYAAGRLGLLCRLTVEGAVFTPVYPSTGVALACLLVLGLGCWPGITLGAFFLVLSVGSPGPDAVGILVGQTAGPVCAYLTLRRVGFRTDLSRLRDGLALVFLGAFGAMLVSSTVGVVSLMLAGKLDPTHFWPTWLAWWVGDAMGVLIITPVLLVLFEARRLPSLSRWKEVLALVAVAAVLVPLATHSSLSALFLVYPLLIWAALRFRLAGSMLCALFASVTATVAATEGIGAFTRLSPVEVMVKLQLFNGSLALTALLLSAVITEQYHTRLSVEEACEELAEALEHLTAHDSPAGRAPPGAAEPPRERGTR
ncbi:MASE1 domain-containing protein [Streptomyces fuscichromogenes]|uniref:Membrane protein n=1 Tax=Streptomyces fuscichromogenes TaxID=1324013 RepID=A0A917XD61_9ACTN|nr:MASE1 domain-containing protein [Streptomyces fuscichromogenes]GGN11449.1 membrane protein [Streptomyces fuscichromogenes]